MTKIVTFLSNSVFDKLHYLKNHEETLKPSSRHSIDLVTVFNAILTSRQTCEKLQCLCENVRSNNFRKTAVLKKNMNCKLKLQSKGLSYNIWGTYLCLNFYRGLL